MSQSELERLARIRMQVTKESLERALAALQGHPIPDDEEPAPEQETEQETEENTPPPPPAPPCLRLLP
ncbi:hypothetical protein [Streptomyces pinistramenti]|uniref:hypothetical protein n=1 Tax=Streptomyces pinistramenti TaxID=2884812 RepID=UPI001D097ABB|nr:hypothetical protein [Streptomyces pinistramenti]MCB5908952.1 hypothetical protein [Streptomyces pinistramenti]